MSETTTKSTPRVVATDVGFAEGPLYTPAGDVYFTSITQGRLYRLTDSGADVVADLGGGANGAALGADGTIYVAQNGARWSTTGPKWGPDSVGGVQAVRPDGTFAWLHRDPIAPNDLCFGPDGLLYVTDPTRAPFAADGRIWRIDPATAEAELLCSVPWFPNGIGFGLDDRLYLASTYDARIIAFRLDEGKLVDEETVVRMDVGHPDGFTFDTEGNLIVCAINLDGGAGVIQTWSVTGKKLDQFQPGDNGKYTNIALDGAGQLVICDSDGGQLLVVDEWPARGLDLYPFRGGQ